MQSPISNSSSRPTAGYTGSDYPWNEGGVASDSPLPAPKSRDGSDGGSEGSQGDENSDSLAQLKRSPWEASPSLTGPAATVFEDEGLAATGITVAAGTVVKDVGTRRLIENPEIVKTWESTTSAWTGKGGFTDGAVTKLQNAGINVNDAVPNPVPAGSVVKTKGITPGSVTTHNGNLARDAIESRAIVQGLNTRTEVHFDAEFNRLPTGSENTVGSRHVDVEIERPHPTDPRLNQLEHIESKAMRVSAGDVKNSQLAHDAGMLSNNRAVRAGGFALEKAGKLARPVGLVVDTVSVVNAVRRDGGVGEETGRTITGIAGGAAGGFAGVKAGAAVGAAVGSIIPGAGTAAGAVVGGVIGGIAGAIGGESIAKSAFSAVKGWF